MWLKYSFLFFIISFAGASQIGLDDIDRLLKDATIISLDVYAEIPDSDLFFTNNAFIFTPAKFVNYSDYLMSFFSRWEEKEINDRHLKTSLVFGNVDEKTRPRSQTNLRRFLKIKDDYTDETSASFRMPKFLRELIDVPTVLNCDHMLTKIHDLRFDFFLNFQTYVSIKNPEQDRLACALKGEGSVFILDEKNLKKYKTFKQDPSKQNIKEIRYNEFPLVAGQCLFLPSKLDIFLKSDSLWLYTIQWKHIDAPLNYKQCYPHMPSREEQAKAEEKKKKKSEAEVEVEDEEDVDDDEVPPMVFHRKLSAFKCETDADQEKFEKEIELLNHFLGYFGHSQAFTQPEFLAKIKKDSKIFKSGKSCDNECIRLIKKAFIELDLDKDESFQIEDFENLDQESAVNANKKLSNTVDAIQGKTPEKSKPTKEKGAPDMKKPYNLNLGGVEVPIDLEPLEKLAQTAKTIKDVIEGQGQMGNVVKMLMSKVTDMTKKLSPEKRQKLEKINFYELADVFSSILGVDHIYQDIMLKMGQSDGQKKEPVPPKQSKPAKDDDDDDDDDDDKGVEIQAEDESKPNKKEKEDL